MSKDKKVMNELKSLIYTQLRKCHNIHSDYWLVESPIDGE